MTGEKKTQLSAPFWDGNFSGTGVRNIAPPAGDIHSSSSLNFHFGFQE
jgi:hypothetical protein